MPTDVLERYGNGEFPLNFVPTASNGNFLEPNEVAVRHGYCGDPEQVQSWLLPGGHRKFTIFSVRGCALTSMYNKQATSNYGVFLETSTLHIVVLLENFILYPPATLMNDAPLVAYEFGVIGVHGNPRDAWAVVPPP